MTNISSARVARELGTIEEQERADERRAAERDAAQTESIVAALTQPRRVSDPR